MEMVIILSVAFGFSVIAAIHEIILHFDNKGNRVSLFAFILLVVILGVGIATTWG